MSIGAKIKEIRERRRLTQDQCAERAGVSKKQWWRWEHDAPTPPLHSVHAIARALGVTFESLTGKEAKREKGNEARRAMRAVAAVYDTEEGRLSEEEKKAFRVALAGYVRLIERAALGDEIENDDVGIDLEEIEETLKSGPKKSLKK